MIDVGAGAGRDAAWLSSMGHSVLAVEPSQAMREEGSRRHPELEWLDDRLPALERAAALGRTFGLAHLSAVWMHVEPQDRQEAFSSVAALAEPGGLVSFLVRVPHLPERGMHPTDPGEIPRLAEGSGMEVVHREDGAKDHFGREGVSWSRLMLRK